MICPPSDCRMCGDPRAPCQCTSPQAHLHEIKNATADAPPPPRERDCRRATTRPRKATSDSQSSGPSLCLAGICEEGYGSRHVFAGSVACARHARSTWKLRLAKHEQKSKCKRSHVVASAVAASAGNRTRMRRRPDSSTRVVAASTTASMISGTTPCPSMRPRNASTVTHRGTVFGGIARSGSPQGVAPS